MSPLNYIVPFSLETYFYLSTSYLDSFAAAVVAGVLSYKKIAFKRSALNLDIKM